MGAQSAEAALTESRGGAASAGSNLFVGIDVGRHHHQVAAIPRERMDDGSWERAAARSFAANAMGFRDLVAWLESSGLSPEQVRVGCEPTGGWYSRTVVTWLETHGYQIDWLQNWAVHERRQLILGKQTKTDALDARLIARLLYQRERLGQSRAFLHPTVPGRESLRMLVRNRLKLVNFRTRYRLQLGRRAGRAVSRVQAVLPGTEHRPNCPARARAFPHPGGTGSGASGAGKRGGAGGGASLSPRAAIARAAAPGSQQRRSDPRHRAAVAHPVLATPPIADRGRGDRGHRADAHGGVRRLA